MYFARIEIDWRRKYVRATTCFNRIDGDRVTVVSLFLQNVLFTLSFLKARSRRDRNRDIVNVLNERPSFRLEIVYEFSLNKTNRRSVGNDAVTEFRRDDKRCRDMSSNGPDEVNVEIYKVGLGERIYRTIVFYTF